jgi:hypothetical protein
MFPAAIRYLAALVAIKLKLIKTKNNSFLLILKLIQRFPFDPITKINYLA